MMQRYLAVAPPGLVMTAALLLAMQGLIASGLTQAPIVDPGVIPLVPLPQVKEKPVEQDERPLRIVAPVTPPPRPESRVEGDDGLALRLPRPMPIAPGGSYKRSGPLQILDAPLIHVVKGQPTYPASARARGLEGFVTVRFDVDAEGRPQNLRVIDSSHGVFESAALRAAGKFRFKARVVDGAAVPVADMNYRFRFQIDD